MNEVGLHPNWRALATVHFPYKVFVSAETSSSLDNKVTKKQNELKNVTGKEAKEFYENTINSENASEKCQFVENVRSAQFKSKNRNLKPTPKKIPFEKNKFFRAATANDVETLKLFQYKNRDINVRDEFGWTALMMAACEGAEGSFSYLLKLGADLDKCDKKGNTAASFAKLKGFTKILNLIKNNCKSRTNTPSETIGLELRKSNQPFYCETCKVEFKETSIKEHETSTIHRFNMKNYKKNSNRFNISENNRGLRLMLKQGWDRNSGLGPTNSGPLYPIKTVIRKQRTGLGIKQDNPKVTHFKAYDTEAIKYKAPPRQMTIKELEKKQKREKRKEFYYRRELN